MRTIHLVVVLTALTSTLVAGQQRGNPPAPPGQPVPPAQAGQRGGRGRGGVQVMTLASSAWPDGSAIPAKYTQAGEDMSPPLQWNGAPDGVLSYVLVVHDADAAIGNGTDDILHWLLWNSPATVTSLHEHAPSIAQLPDGTRQIIRGRKEQ